MHKPVSGTESYQNRAKLASLTLFGKIFSALHVLLSCHANYELCERSIMQACVSQSSVLTEGGGYRLLSL